MSITRRIKKFIMRVYVAVRRTLRRMEARLDKIQPHPVLGVLLVIAGLVIALAGLAMCVLPGPGLVTFAVGVACIVMGVKTVRGDYGPHRVERERKAKHERMERRRQKRRKKE